MPAASAWLFTVDMLTYSTVTPIMGCWHMAAASLSLARMSFWGAGSSAELDALLGAGASNSSVNVTAAPSRPKATAQETPKGFDKFTSDYMGSSGSSQVC